MEDLRTESEKLRDTYDERFGLMNINDSVLSYLRDHEMVDAALEKALKRGSPVTEADLPKGAELVPEDADVVR